jgi:hypothetical protein
MSPSVQIDDVDQRDLLDLTDADALATFFGGLGYTVDRLEQVAENLGIVAESTCRPIRRVERLVSQGDVPPFEVYLFELSKLTLTHTRALVKTFRDRVGFFLLVLTSDWQRLDFVYVERLAPESGAGDLGAFRGPERVRVRPRILSVDRRAPHRVDLRVLRRLRWTSADSIGQDQKVLSAYAVAEPSRQKAGNGAGDKVSSWDDVERD